jgi:proteasome lid subunit RPN8/RPN11
MMLAQARTEYPNECCGLLAGRLITENSSAPEMPAESARQVGAVAACYPLVNEAASPVEYFSEPKSLFAAVRDIDRRGLEILAVYHSHPTSEPIPSKKDLARNYSEEVVNLIISLRGAAPETRGWWLTESEYREAEWECVDDSP